MGNDFSSRDENEYVGYRVLGVQPNSPSADANLVSFFDFIIEANGVPLKVLDSQFMDIIQVRVITISNALHIFVYICTNICCCYSYYLPV